MKWRPYVGLDLSSDHVRAVVLRKRWRRGAQLVAHAVRSAGSGCTPDALERASAEIRSKVSLAIRHALREVGGLRGRVALSLPDRCGYVLTLDIDSLSRGRREGRDVVGWQVRRLLPATKNLHFDYQVLRRTTGGRVRLLVVAVETEILGLYDEVLGQAGIAPCYIGFYGLNLYRHWRYRLEPEGDAVFVAMHGDGVVLQAYRDGVLEHYRARSVGAQVERQVRELHRIWAGAVRDFAAHARARVFLHVDGSLDGGYLEALNDCFGRKVQLLDGHPGYPPIVAAASGAAECLMMGG